MSFLQEIIAQPFLQYAIWASLLSSAACGILGTYVVARRSSYMVGAVSHSLLGGIGLALFCQICLGLAFFTPLLGAIFASLVVSTAVTWLSHNPKVRSDTVLSGIWTLGVAIGLCFTAALPGYVQDLNGYLFGNILLISKADMLLMLVLDICILPVAWLFHNQFLALCFNAEGLELRGISPFRTAWILNTLIGLTVVLLSQAVGIVMVLALMVLPPAAAGRISKSMPRTMLLAAVFCFVSCFAGLWLSYSWNWPAGAVIIITATVIYALASLPALRRKREVAPLS